MMAAGSRAQEENKFDILRVIMNYWVRMKKIRNGSEYEVFNAKEKGKDGKSCLGKSWLERVTKQYLQWHWYDRMLF